MGMGEENKNILQNLDYMTHVEDLSNENFYEIFEYMEYHDLFNAFSNLNNRFEDLLNYPFLALKINFGSTKETEVRNYYTQFIIPNKHRIVSLYLTDCSDIITTRSSLYIIDSLFNRLELLTLNRVQHREFISFFPILTSLSRLFSITIQFNDNIVDLTEIYRLIFRLSFLKNIEISTKGYLLIIPLPINTSEQYSPIKRLIINHVCNLKELIVLLSNTPLLTHLVCMELTKQDQHVLQIISIKMIHLKSVTFNLCNVQFDQMEIFIEKLCKQLRILSINTSEDVNYLDAIRWERLITKHMSYLRIFKFEYHEWHYQSIELTSYHNLFNQFTSLFWINRGWFFQITADIDYWPPIKIIYSIRSDRKKWDNIKLIIDRLYFATSRESLANVFFSFLSKIHITHLDVDCKKLLYPKFMKLLCILSDLKSLGILSLSSFKLKCLSQEENELVKIWSSNNQIKKLVVNSFIEEIDLEKIQYFIDLCPRLEYLKVKCQNNFNIKSIVRYILMKNINKFNLFCLLVPIANDDMVNQLQTMIYLEKLVDDYRITRTTNRMYIQLKL